MKVPGLNLHELMARLGIQRQGWSPELAELVQPVGVVFDASSLVSPLLPPTAFFGTLTPAPAGVSCFQIVCRSPGGCFVRNVGVAATGTLSIVYRLLAAPVVLVNPFLPAANNMGPSPVQSFVQTGERAAQFLALTDPTQVVVGNTRMQFIDDFFVPPGQVLYFESTGPSALKLHVVLQEAPSIPDRP